MYKPGRNQKKVSSGAPPVDMSAPFRFNIGVSDQQPNKAAIPGPSFVFNPPQFQGGMENRMPAPQGLPLVPQNLFTLQKAENHGPAPAFPVNDLQRQKQHVQQGFPSPTQNVVTLQKAENCEPVPAVPVNHLQQQQKETEKPLYSQFEKKIRPCIDLVDSLRALGVEKDLALPAIVVIGDQSSGKSSVLEALSGVALPRGSGIVTRCPLALKLKKTHHSHGWKGKISFRDTSQELFYPSEVEKEIKKAQLSVAGAGVSISHELITLEISSPEVSDLTLIDLPGIARVAVGNQPQDIGHQIKRLIKQFIVKDETINLVVVPSNVDIATTEALKMAQEVDPDGERTLGILTKPDLVDKGTEEGVVATVRNLIIHLKKGYMIVKCRGQQDILSNLDLATAIQKEKAFFENHEQFRDLLRERKATIPLLAEKLTSELVEHISKSLPTLEEQINTQLHKANQDLLKYGKGTPKTDNERFHFLLEKIKLFNQDINDTTQGEEKLSGNDTKLITKIRGLFHEWERTLDESALNIQKVNRQMGRKLEDQFRGRELPGFNSYNIFETFMRKQMRDLEAPAIEILKKVTEMVQQAFTNVAKDHFADFKNLYRAAKDKIETIKETQLEEAERTVKTHFAMEKYLYCQDKVYAKDLMSVREQTLAETNASDKEMACHLEAYFKSAGKRLSCQIPLIILFHMLTENREKMENEMLRLLQAKEEYGSLLQERKDVAEQRQLLWDQIERLTQAKHHLAKFPG